MKPRQPATTDFDRWNADQYLAQYYGCVEADEAATLDFISRACRRVAVPGRALAFGIGPTVHHLLPLVPHAREVHVADYLESNLDHVRRWLRREPHAHDWRPFARHVLGCEGVHAPTDRQVDAREHLVRTRVTQCLRGDAGCESPPATLELGPYATVLSCFCAESATGDKRVWRGYVRNIVRLLEPGGLFITAALRRCTAYHVGQQRFACADIDEHDLADVLRDAGFAPSQMHVEVRAVGLRDRLGYDSIVLVAAHAPRDQPTWWRGPASRATQRS